MPKKDTLLIFIPDGTGIKNYLLSSFIQKASKEFELILAHNFDKAINDEINIKPSEYKKASVPSFKEPITIKFYREALCFARLNFNSKLKNNPSILINWRRNFKHPLKKIFYIIIEIYGLYLSKKYSRIENLTLKFHQKVQSSNSILPFANLIKKHEPDLILTTHQRSVLNLPFLAAAKTLNRKSISVIYSWDNMPKARIPYYSDYYFVWSEYMKLEFKSYYPEINLDNVLITGTPQFEFYNDEALIMNREDYFNLHNLDIQRPVVCYSGDDTLTSPFDPNYLRDMASEFLKIDLNKRPQIILRPCPADDGERFKPVLEEFPGIRFAAPDWYENNENSHWAVKFPKKNDIKQLVNLAFHADAVVNVGSTMAHDFAMFNKPAFYLNYMPNISSDYNLTNHEKKWKIKTIYKYEHFKSINNLNPVYWVNSKSEFNSIINSIENPDKTVSQDQRSWRDKILGEFSQNQSSYQLVKALKSI
jgi:hypothetical protein